MIEGESTGEHRVMPKIDGKDKITDPFAIEIRAAFKELKLPFQQIRPDIGAENRIIRNAGILVGQFRNRYFESDAEIEKRRLTKEWLEEKTERGTLKEKDIDCFESMKRKESRYSKLLEGNLSKSETTDFLDEVQSQIPRTLRMIPGIYDDLGDDPKLTIGELIALSSIHKDQNPKVLENALSYLIHSNGIGLLVLEQLKDYLLRLDKGIYQAVYDDKHVTPLVNGNI